MRKYLFSLDHKVVGLQYYLLALTALIVAVSLSVLMRLRLTWPEDVWPLFSKLLPSAFNSTGQMTPDFYLALMTMHGTIMIFFVLTIAPQAAFGNYFLPLQIGANQMAAPRLGQVSFWITTLAFCILMTAFFVAGGAPLAGWTAYPPLSVITSGTGYAQGMNLWLISLAVFSIAAILNSLNFMVTILEHRTSGMQLMRMPLTCWGWMATAMISLLAFPVLLAAGLLLLLDRLIGTDFFTPSGMIVNGQIIDLRQGIPILWQHLFWFFGHPEVYLAILPGMGVVSHILATFSRKPVFGYRTMVWATLAIALLGFLVWGHHMFVAGISPYLSMTFSFLTLTIAIPSAIKTLNWLGTMWGGKIRLATPMLYAIGFVSLFITGGLGGIFLGQSSLDIYLHDTYFVVGHFHLIMGSAAVFAIFAATTFWFPKVFGRQMNEDLGKVHFFLTFIGVYAIFLPMHFLGIAGNPRRYAEISQFIYLNQLQPLHKFITIAMLITVNAQLLFFINLITSIFAGKKVNENPWQSTTLEWTVTSPPPKDNFSEPPSVCRGAYDFSLPGEAQDFLMQTQADSMVAEDKPVEPK
ncbi:MAG: cytochrome c oxidase subunit I [bacterium]|nr:MAG: cytochrome c oxidase subunit I [bacterium]